MAEITIKSLLESGAHFGHQKNRWNPKMKRFIFEARNGLYVIDLAKTMQQIRDALVVVQEVIAKKQSILFVGTKKQAKAVMRESAESCNEFYICERWLGGMLTNWKTIRQSVKKLEHIEKKITRTDLDLTKKELALLSKQQQKLDANLSGVRAMRKMPGLVIVVDPGKEHLAVAEARKLNIPVMALVDTNCNPDIVDYVIACNDDSLKCVRLIVQALAEAITEKKKALGTFHEETPVAEDENKGTTVVEETEEGAHDNNS